MEYNTSKDVAFCCFGTFSTQVRRPNGGDSFEGFTSWKNERLQFKKYMLLVLGLGLANFTAMNRKQHFEIGFSELPGEASYSYSVVASVDCN